MGGINSLSGLNTVNVDFRPTVELIKSKPDKSNQPLPGADAVPENAPQHNDNAYVRDFLIRECPSIYKRDFLHLMFAKPQSA